MDELTEVESTENNEMNHLTMELLVNKNHYSKILHKINPTKFKEREIYIDKIKQHKYEILSIFENLLDSPQETITRDLNDSFDIFIKTCIKHLEIRELDDFRKYDDAMNDNEVLFGSEEIKQDSSKSFWGQKIGKMRKP
jgi:hypothetical protein